MNLTVCVFSDKHQIPGELPGRFPAETDPEGVQPLIIKSSRQQKNTGFFHKFRAEGLHTSLQQGRKSDRTGFGPAPVEQPGMTGKNRSR